MGKDFFSGKGQSVPEEEEEEKEELHVSKRKKRIDFSSTVGVSVFDGDARKVGFVCKICNHTCKDNLDYLDHLNDPSLLAKAGISREIKKCTVDDVRGVLTGKRTRKEYDFDKNTEKRKEEDEQEKEEKREKKRRKKEEEEEHQGIDEDMAKMMGLPMSFGSSKKK